MSDQENKSTFKKWKSISDNEFESILADSIPEIPSDYIVAEVTPWKKAMNRVLAGMALCAITLNFLCLNYILPAVGMVLSLLGFRSLRRENRWFGICFIITVIRAAYFFPALILNTTVIQSAVSAASVTSALTIANLLLLLAGFFCIWRGLRAVQRKAGLPPRAGGAVALMIWYALMYVLSVVQYSGLVIPIAFIAGYFFILRSIYHLSKELDEAGYSIQTAPIKISDESISLVIAAVLIAGCALGYLFGGSYPMDWSVVDSSEHAGVEEVKAHLLALGFPEYVLDDLTAEDIKACDGAVRVVADVTDEPMNDGRTVTTVEYVGDGRRYIQQSTVYDTKELRITGVGVQLPGERESWLIFHHFLWTTDPGFYGTESIQLWPVYRDISKGWTSAGDATGRVLCDQDGKTLSAPYHSLGEQAFTTNSLIWGPQTSTDLFATFSMPAKGERHRGYVAYPVEEAQDGYIISSWINYTHQRSWLQYPVVTAMEKRMTSWQNNAGAFLTVQDALQFYPTEENVELINAASTASASSP